MATRLVNIDRETPMFLPPDLRDWIPDLSKNLAFCGFVSQVECSNERAL